MHRLRSAMLVTVLAVASSSCFLLRGGDEEGAPAPERDRDITLLVHNQNFYDATLYAVHGGYRVRIGFVNGNQEETFTFRWRQIDLQVDIHLIGAGSYLSDSLPVDEGDVLELWIEPDLHLKVRRARGAGSAAPD